MANICREPLEQSGESRWVWCHRSNTDATFLFWSLEFFLWLRTFQTLSCGRGGNKIWIFKPQVNFDVIPTYKHGGKWFFEFGGHLNPPHLRWSFRFFGDFRPFQRNLYIFINAGLEPKLFEIKSSTQQQSCKAHKIGQFCHQDQPSICLCSRVTDRATTAFHLAPKW